MRISLNKPSISLDILFLNNSLYLFSCLPLILDPTYDICIHASCSPNIPTTPNNRSVFTKQGLCLKKCCISNPTYNDFTVRTNYNDELLYTFNNWLGYFEEKINIKIFK